MSDAVIFIGSLAIGLYLVANGVYALADPAEWFKAGWTAKRGYRREDLSTWHGRLMIYVWGMGSAGGGFFVLFWVLWVESK